MKPALEGAIPATAACTPDPDSLYLVTRFINPFSPICFWHCTQIASYESKKAVLELPLNDPISKSVELVANQT